MTDETIFTTALELPSAVARTEYLTEVCGGDGERRARIERLLAAHAKAGGFMEQPPAPRPDPDFAPTISFGTGGDESEPDDALAVLAPPGRPDSLGRIGHYEVLQVLGKGGFGVVYRAFDDVLQRVVAVKVLAPQMAATSPARKRFLREARTSAQVRHENVVQVYEVGEHPLPYLVMEFIPGETLQARLDRTGPLDVAEVVRIGRQIAEGLAAAHATDLIHRDIKPANILIDGGQQRVKITDFGLARAADDASISQSGIIAGTPMFMAPEQALGHTIDQRADLFSLGSVLYQMVAGRPPFRANNTLAVLKRVTEDTPRPIREIIPEAPQWLCDIIAKLHAKNPGQRFQSAREVADLLAECEAKLKASSDARGFPKVAPPALVDAPTVALAPPAARLRRPRWKWAAAGALILGAVVSAAVLLPEVLKQPDQPPAHRVPERPADVLAFIQGTWKREAVIVVPKLPPEKARSYGQLTFDAVAGGKVMRGVSVDEHGRETDLILHSYDAATDQIKSWVFPTEGEVTVSPAGVYNPANRSFLWMEPLPDGTQSVHHLDFVDANTVRVRNYDLDAVGKIVYQSHATFTRTNQPPAVPKAEIDPKRPAEMKVLDRLAGEWRTELSVGIPGTPTKKEVHRTTARSMVGGRVIETVNTHEATNGTDYSVLWYDTAAKRYRLAAFLGDGQEFGFTGTWDEASKKIELAEPNGVRFGDVRFENDDLYHLRRAAKNPAGTVVFDATGVARRVGAPTPPPASYTGVPPKAVRGNDNCIPYQYSPDGKWLVTRDFANGRIGALRVWEVATGEVRATFADALSQDREVAFSPDGKLMAHPERDGGRLSVVVRNVGTFDVVKRLACGANNVEGVAFDRTGTVVGASVDTAVILWTARTGEEVLRVSGDFNQSLGITFSPTADLLALCDGRGAAQRNGRFEHDARVHLYDIDPKSPKYKQRLHTWDAPDDGFTSRVQFTPDGANVLFCRGEGGVIRVAIHDVKTGAKVREIVPQQAHTQITLGAISPNGKRLVLRHGQDGVHVGVWNLDDGTRVSGFDLTGKAYRAFAVDSTFRTACIGFHTTAEAKFYDLATGKELMPGTAPPEVKAPPTFKNNLGMEFVLVPKGKSWLGGGKDKLGDKVETVPADFYLGKYEVTQEEWEKVMGANPSFFSRMGKGKDTVKDIPDADLKRFPVENVSWNDCQDFIKKLNEREKETGWAYRLPKEAEWEYACRGGPMTDKVDSAFDFYFAKPTNTLLPNQANIDSGLSRTCKVGSYEANRLGLFDMHGNAWEWCGDTEKAPDGPSHHVFRGGGWDNPSTGCLTSVRQPNHGPGHQSLNVGLRVARFRVDAFTDADLKRIAALSSLEQVEEVRKELIKRNPKFEGALAPTTEGNVIVKLEFWTDNVADISPLRALTGLKALAARGTEGKGQLTNLAPLQGLPLTMLDVNNNGQLADLTPLKTLPLTQLFAQRTAVPDLAPLAGLRLTELNLSGTPVADLAPLKDMPLIALYLDGTKVADLTPLKGMPLKIVNIRELKLAPARDHAVLRGLTALETINSDPAAEFLKENDKK